MQYTHIPTGRLVSPAEFEARYMCMVEEVSAVRSKAWGDYFAKLSRELNATRRAPVDHTNDDYTELSASNNEMDDVKEMPPHPEETVGEESMVYPDEMESMESTSQDNHEETEDMCTDVIYKTVDTSSEPPSEEIPSTTPTKMLPRAPSPTSPRPASSPPSSSSIKRLLRE